MRALIENNLALGKISWEYDSSAKGTVIEQSLTATSSVPAKVSKVDFVLSLGPEPVQTTEPEPKPKPVDIDDTTELPDDTTDSPGSQTDSGTDTTDKAPESSRGLFG